MLRSLVRSLEALGVDVVFGIPGGAILPAYDPLFDSETVRHILVRHEQGAGHAATGYAQATGKVGVCMATSGPGRDQPGHADRRRVHGLRRRWSRSPARSRRPRSAPTPSRKPTSPASRCRSPSTTTWCRPARSCPRVLAEAFHLASTGRPGPVLVDIPKDVLQNQTTFSWPPTLDLPGYQPDAAPARQADPRGGPADRRRPAARAVRRRRRASGPRPSEVLRKLAELTGAPVVTTLMARGAFPDSHPQHLGMPGMHGTVARGLRAAEGRPADRARRPLRRPGDRQAGDVRARTRKIIHADIDPAEIGKNRDADVPIVGDAQARHRRADRAPCRRVRAGHRADARPTGGRTLATSASRTRWATRSRPTARLAPQYVIERIGKIVGPDAIYVAGVGQHQMWAAQFIAYENPATWLNSGGLGTMGYAVPAAMGAKVGRPDTRCGRSTATAASR